MTAQPIASMTGYGRAAGSLHGVGFICEIKTVNGRGLDMRMRIAPGFDGLEPELRRRITARLSRGSVTFSLSVDRQDQAGDIVIDEKALAAVLDALTRLGAEVDAAKPRLDGILAIPGIVERRDRPLADEQEEQLHAAILSAADTAIAALEADRRREGAQLLEILAARIEDIAALTARAEAHPARTRDAIVSRLREQVAALIDTGVGLSEERLAQEALVLATRADIREELDRLVAHIANARQLLKDGGPIGRRLDFLAQEFNREANTLCSKSNAVDLTAIGLDLKAAIDQLREQVQNIE